MATSIIRFNIAGKRKTKLTPFEWKVLKVVSRIPIGQTRSYVWVAKKAGRPASARAVGHALHKNPFPLLVPCHRVIAKDGSIGGFAFGVRTKTKLLFLEKEISREFYQK